MLALLSLASVTVVAGRVCLAYRLRRRVVEAFLGSEAARRATAAEFAEVLRSLGPLT